MECPLEIFARECPDGVAVIAEGREWNSFELNELVIKESLNIKAGSIESFLGHTDLKTIVHLFGALRAGAVALPLNTRNPKWTLPETPAAGAALMLYTSGSMGIPKLAALSRENFYYSALGSIEAVKLEFQDKWLLSLPLFHVGGLAILFRCFMAKATVVLDKNVDCTHLSFVPTQLYRLLKENKTLNAKCILLGGGPVSEAMMKQAKERGMNVFETYSLTEMTSQVTMDGKVLPYRELKIEEDGEILVRGKTLALGLEGWYHTKDLGCWDIDGKLRIIGRKDNLFISGGENIQPEEIELALCQIQGITNAIVVPAKDEEFGMRPVAFIEGPCDLEKIRKELSSTLPKYKIPIAIYPLPAHLSLKPNRRELQNII